MSRQGQRILRRLDGRLCHYDTDPGDNVPQSLYFPAQNIVSLYNSLNNYTNMIRFHQRGDGRLITEAKMACHVRSS